MKEITQIENRQVEIWRRPYQRSLKLTVRPEGSLRVTCGRRVSVREITRFVRDSHEFIEKRVLEIEHLKKRFPIKNYVSGEEFLFFGMRLPLAVVWTWRERPKLKVEGRQLELLAPVAATRGERQKALQDFYKKQARLHLLERIQFWAVRMELRPRQISIRGQRTRWGSCTSRGDISMNWKLLCAPEKVIDYVIIHELAHLEHMNHSPRFWGLVARFEPEWKSQVRWLKVHEYEIGVQFPSR